MDYISGHIKYQLSTNNFLTENEINVGNALVKILDDWEMLFTNVSGSNKFNKNLILYYLREITCLSTKDIRVSMKKYKIIYDLMKKERL